LAWWDVTNSTRVRFAGNVTGNNVDGDYQMYYEMSGELVADMSKGRSLTLYQRDPALSDGEMIAELRCRQNDATSPALVTGSIAFMAEGSSGGAGIGFFTGTGTPTEKWRIRNNPGELRPSLDDTYDLGATAFRVKTVHAFTVRTHARTVATLPVAATVGAGSRAFVTDANATTFASIVAAGGANGVPVYSDGTNWRIG
jgi:hypothetical protein